MTHTPDTSAQNVPHPRPSQANSTSARLLPVFYQYPGVQPMWSLHGQPAEQTLHMTVAHKLARGNLRLYDNTMWNSCQGRNLGKKYCQTRLMNPKLL